VDGAEGIAEADEEWLSARPHALRVWNKVDDPRARVVPEGWIAASAIAEGGTLHLVETVVAALGADGAGASGAVASEDQRATLEHAREALADALAGHEEGVPRDALAPDLRTAVTALDELLGEGASFDALEEIFSRFCVGK
jgi:tRNA U34 5-carboxymethylaminomethyl modifying GTPase MnmE/TrmE